MRKWRYCFSPKYRGRQCGNTHFLPPTMDFSTIFTEPWKLKRQLQGTYFDYALHEIRILILDKILSTWFPVKANQLCGSPQGVRSFMKGKIVIHLTVASVGLMTIFIFKVFQSKKLIEAHLIHNNVVIALCRIHVTYAICVVVPKICFMQLPLKFCTQ